MPQKPQKTQKLRLRQTHWQASTVLSEAEAAVPASPPRLTDTEVDEILSGEGRGKHGEIQAVGFPQDSWTPAQARKWLKDHGAVPIKGHAARRLVAEVAHYAAGPV